ncbi:DUF2892 domain-containing protein [Dyadobacter sp. CY312]|uniref:YgaP family membrane protein n=1 Tax=Dyadobacter sp. CY312 TaxID=2907303 RepID=UPI001F3C6CFC|nr:DUF2892 domain-containing protein [Dyadobacter sp. CY312]MCE7043146.1 DUF2892 domain-containing protein [Dyadobacter sp. CY312]
MESTISFIKDKIYNASESIEEVQNVSNAERLISVLAGALITYYGMQKKETVLGKGLIFVGGLLITRGTTGFCPVNKAVNRNSIPG